MRKEWKKSLLVFKMSQRSLFEYGVSKNKADKSDFADNAESVPTSASSDQPQQPTKITKTFVGDTREDPFTLPGCLVRPV